MPAGGRPAEQSHEARQHVPRSECGVVLRRVRLDAAPWREKFPAWLALRRVFPNRRCTAEVDRKASLVPWHALHATPCCSEEFDEFLRRSLILLADDCIMKVAVTGRVLLIGVERCMRGATRLKTATPRSPHCHRKRSHLAWAACGRRAEASRDWLRRPASKAGQSLLRCSAR